MPHSFSLSHRSSLIAAALLLAGCGGGGFLGMGGSEAGQLCLELEASKELNLFDGQPHVVVVHFYPLANVTAFEATPARDLIRGAKPDGLAGEPWRTTVLPGQKLKLGEKVSEQAEHLAVVADYYGGPSRVVVPADCDDEEGKVVRLSRSAVAVSSADDEDGEWSDE